MKPAPEVLAIATRELASVTARLRSWQEDAQSEPDRALRRAEDAAEYYEFVGVWSEVVRALSAPDTKATPATLLEYAQRRLRSSLVGDGRSTDILARARTHARAMAWQEVVNVIVEP